ncbi:MAG: diacylglycerol kinase family protein [Candidatus Zixiibacteriota bacterium]
MLNPFAGGGKAHEKWMRIRPDIQNQLGFYEVYELDNRAEYRNIITKKINEGEREFIAAGGDGTINLLLNALAAAPDSILKQIKLGAIGLGSSNDFHKPFRYDRMLKCVPYRINFANTIQSDIGVVTYFDARGKQNTRYWLVNSSIGITAEANLSFNTPNKILGYIKEHSTSGAILYAALSTLVRFRAREIGLKINGQSPEDIFIENVAIVRNPYFSGNFHYSTPAEINAGCFHVHLVARQSIPRKLLTLWKLSRSGQNNGLTRVRRASYLHISSREPLTLEFDGETVMAQEACFTLRNRMIQVCID